MSKHIGAYSSLHGPAGKVLTDYVEENIPALWDLVPEEIINVSNTGAIYTGDLPGWGTHTTLNYYPPLKLLWFRPHVPNSTTTPKLSISGLAQLPIKYDDGTTPAVGSLKLSTTYLFRITADSTVFEIIGMSSDDLAERVEDLEETDEEHDARLDALEAADPETNVNGIAALRLIPVTANRIVRLNYHTTRGDLGTGLFRGTTTGGPYTDDNGTIVTADGTTAASAWLRIWDGVTAHVGWFGAKCDRVTDDFIAVRNCLNLFSQGRTALRTGNIDVGPGFAFSQPLIWASSFTGTGFKWRGHYGLSRSAAVTEPSYLIYSGPATLAALIFYGGAEFGIENCNISPGNARNGVLCTADNTFNQTLTAPITAGANRVASLSGASTILFIGAILGVDAGDNFEIVQVKSTGGSSFTADFLKPHASGVQVGGSSGQFSHRFNRCRFLTPASPVYTTLTSNNPGGGVQEFTPASMSGITVGTPLRIGSYDVQEITHVTGVTLTTFSATVGQSHTAGDLIMVPTAGVYFGNRIQITVQVSEGQFTDCSFAEEIVDRGFCAVRQVSGGNTKNFYYKDCKVSAVKVGFACADSNGTYVFNGMTTAGIKDSIFVFGAAQVSVVGLEDESNCYWIRQSSGSATTSAVFTNCYFASGSPQTNGEVVFHSGSLTFINCLLRQANPATEQIPYMVIGGILSATSPASLVMINCVLSSLTATTPFVRAAPESTATDPVGAGIYQITLLGCKGYPPAGGPMVTIPPLIPPNNRWQATSASLDPVSRPAGTCSSIQTIPLTGAVMGDLVEASSTTDLAGMQLTAWVSAIDVVSFLFNNPTTGPIDLPAGTVIKVRLKK